MNIQGYFPNSLSDDQEFALKQIEIFLSNDTNCLLLKGYAGTGKTYLMQGLVNYLNGERRQVRLFAPTGRAALILGEKTGSDASTIHRGIYNLNKIEDGDHTFQFRYKLHLNEDSDNAVYIVDEASMVSDVFSEDEFFVFGSGHLLQDFFAYVNFRYRTHAKIIFVGDPAQLPPVGMATSPALDSEYLMTRYGVTSEWFELKQVLRQVAGSGILSNATKIRTSLDSDRLNRFEIHPTDDTVVLAGDAFRSNYFAIVDNRVSENVIVIVHSNKRAWDYNSIIRAHFFPNQENLHVGDLLMNTKNNYNYTVDLYNGQIFKVLEVGIVVETPKPIRFIQRGGEVAEVSFAFRDVVVEVADALGEKHAVHCKLIENFLKSEEARLSPIEQQALYVDFKNRHPHLRPQTLEFNEALRTDRYFNAIQVKYGYAVTCHKAQGGEWEHAFVDFDASFGLRSRGFFRWAYTGVTRAKGKLFALNVRSFSPVSEYLAKPILRIVNIPNNQFFVPESLWNEEVSVTFEYAFLKLRYVEIQHKMKGLGIEFEVAHLQWLERYRFWKGEENATIDWNYGANGFTGRSSLLASSSAEFSELIQRLANTRMIHKLEYYPQQEYQKELYALLQAACDDSSLTITNVVEENFRDRYFVQTSASCAYIDCSYNSKGVYTIIQPYSTDGEGDLLLKKLMDKIN